MKNSKGFTLIELIVAMTIGLIFLGCVVALISPSTRIFNRVEDSSDARLLTESVLEELRSQANMATALRAGEVDERGNGTIAIDDSIISVNKEGYLVKTEKDKEAKILFDEGFYKNKTIKMKVEDTDTENCVDVTLNLVSGDNELYKLTSQLKPVIEKKKTIVAGEEVGKEEIEITTDLSWPSEEDMQKKRYPTYLRGDIVKYKGGLYIALQPSYTLRDIYHWGLGPSGLKSQFAKISDTALSESQVGPNGRFTVPVYPGSKYLTDSGKLYIYIHAVGGSSMGSPAVWPTYWHLYN